MKIAYLSLIFLVFMVSPVGAAVKTQVVEYQQGDAILEGYLAYDDSLPGKHPGVVVVHEWMGLNDYVKQRARMLAELGYVAFAADIYGKGIRPQTTADASAQATRYKSDRALLRSRVVAALDILKSLEIVDEDRLAAIGYCFGGTTALELARSGAAVSGVVSFHGGLSSPVPADAKNIKARVLVLHGAVDPFVPADEVAAFEQEMKDAQVNYVLISYPGAVHGFTNPENKGEIPGALYDADADQKSWQAMKDFLGVIFEQPQ